MGYWIPVLHTLPATHPKEKAACGVNMINAPFTYSSRLKR